MGTLLMLFRVPKPIRKVSKRRAKRSGIPGKTGRIRLVGKALTALRLEVFERDHFRCQHVIESVSKWNGRVGIRKCLKAVTWETGHLAHIVSRGAGGSDTADNCLTKCADCHLVKEHNPKSVPSKTT